MATSAANPDGKPALGLGAAIAALVWVLGLGIADAIHIMAAGDVDTTGFVVAVIALSPAWAFIGRNLSISVFGQTASVTINAQDVAAASGQAPAGGGGGGGAAGGGGGGQAPVAPPVTPLEQGANQLDQLAEFFTPWSHAETVRALRQNATIMREHAAAPAPQERVVVYDPPPTGNPPIDLRDRIIVRLNALAVKHGIEVGPGTPAEILLAQLTAAGVLTDPESKALGKFITLGNDVARGRKPGDETTAVVAQSQVAVLANLERKLADA